MNWSAILALAKKDISQILRNRFLAVITLLVVFAMGGLYYAFPGRVEENIELAFYGPQIKQVLGSLATEEEGLKVTSFSSEKALKKKVEAGDYAAGVVLTDDFVQKLMAKQTPEVKVYFSGESPPEIKEGVSLLLKELAYQATGQPLPVKAEGKILGKDMVGEQIPERDKVRTMFVSLALLVEMMSLSVLIQEEGEAGTISAILVTPAQPRDLIAGKAVAGTSLAFVEGLAVLAIVGGLTESVPLLLVTIFLGALLVTGLAFFFGGIAKDIMSLWGWVLPFYFILIFPPMAALFPGLGDPWIRAIPSYYVADTLNRAMNYGVGWDKLWPNLTVLLGLVLVTFYLGTFVLRRRYQ